MTSIQVVTDGNKFERYQNILLSIMVQNTIYYLRKAGIPPENLHKLAGDLLFNLCCLFDGSAILEDEEGEIISPVLTFECGESSVELLTCGGNSYMHESVLSVVKKTIE